MLTYHKVARAPGAEPEFYTVTPDQLDHQLELLARSDLPALQPEDLLTSRSSRPRSSQSNVPLNLTVPPERAGWSAPTGYLLTFDDATVDHYETVLPTLTRYNRRAIFFTPSSKLNRPGYLTTEQARKISQAGHTLGLHSHEHRRLDWLGEEDIRVQMELSMEALGAIAGERPRMFAPPGGFIDRRVRKIALEHGLEVIRTMRWGYNQRFDPKALECVPVNRFFTDQQFRRTLQFRNRSFLYAAKELAKKVLPTKAYERLRAAVFGGRG